MGDNNDAFREIITVEFPHTNVLNYYPYGNLTSMEFVLAGNAIDLKKEYLQAKNKGKTDMDYVVDILQEVGRAMHYLTVHRTFNPNDRQTITAFCMWDLFNSGCIDWNLEMTKDKSHDEIVKLEKLHAKRYSMKRFGYVGGKDPEPNTKEYKEAKRICHIENRKNHGIYEVRYYPLLSDTRKPLYTKQQLAAIWSVVSDEFENLC